MPPEPVDPIYDYLDPISVSLQERQQAGNKGLSNNITGVVDRPANMPLKYLFHLQLIGDINLSRSAAACIGAEIEKNERRYRRKKVMYRISDVNHKTGGWGCWKLKAKFIRPNTSTIHNEHNCTVVNCKVHQNKKGPSYKLASEGYSPKKVREQQIKFCRKDPEAYEDPLTFYQLRIGRQNIKQPPRIKEIPIPIGMEKYPLEGPYHSARPALKSGGYIPAYQRRVNQLP